MAESRRRVIGFWVATAALVLPFGVGGVFDIVQTDDVAKIFTELGYPAYFATMLGVAKLLGLLVVVAPGLPRAKEWAYAGMAFDLSAAFISHLSVTGASTDLAPPLVFLVIVGASWFLRPASRRLEGPTL